MAALLALAGPKTEEAPALDTAVELPPHPKLEPLEMAALLALAGPAIVHIDWGTGSVLALQAKSLSSSAC